MLTLQTRLGFKVQVPENINEDISERFDLSQLDDAKKYYFKYGYVIFNNLISNDKCDSIRELWDNKIKKYKGKIYRQTGGKAEANKFNDLLSAQFYPFNLPSKKTPIAIGMYEKYLKFVKTLNEKRN